MTVVRMMSTDGEHWVPLTSDGEIPREMIYVKVFDVNGAVAPVGEQLVSLIAEVKASKQRWLSTDDFARNLATALLASFKIKERP